jgi:hypothetical protein
MTHPEFAKIMAYIEVALGKPFTKEMAEVYFDLLGDLPYEVMQTAAKRVILEHRWANFPTVAELREAAALTMQGRVSDLSPAEAGAQAWKATGKMDPEQEGSVDRILQGVSPLVREAMVAFGINDLCYGKEPVGVIRGQFLKIYEQLASRDRRTALLPVAVQQAIEQQQPEILKMLENIGHE